MAIRNLSTFIYLFIYSPFCFGDPFFGFASAKRDMILGRTSGYQRVGGSLTLDSGKHDNPWLWCVEYGFFLIC